MKLQCSKCGIIKDEDSFHYRNGHPVFPCKECKKLAIRDIVYAGDPDYPLVTIKRGRGRPKKDIEVVPTKEKTLHVKPLYEDTRIVVMEMSVFTKAIQLVFEQGKQEGKDFSTLHLEEHSLNKTINQILRGE